MGNGRAGWKGVEEVDEAGMGGGLESVVYCHMRPESLAASSFEQTPWHGGPRFTAATRRYRPSAVRTKMALVMTDALAT